MVMKGYNIDTNNYVINIQETLRFNELKIWGMQTKTTLHLCE